VVAEVREFGIVVPFDRLPVEFEDVRQLLELAVVGTYEVDPEDGRPAESRERPGPVDLVDLVTLEQKCGAHAS
jgi:hypothetical protein